MTGVGAGRIAASWSRRAGRALGATLLSAAVIGIPSDVVDTALFTRMTPVHGWEYAVLAATALLTGLWAALPGRPARRGGYGVSGVSLLGALAVGCPVCNKLVVALLGVSGALAVWAPVQPVLGVASVAAMLAAVAVRWRRRRAAACPAPPSSGIADLPDGSGQPTPLSS